MITRQDHVGRLGDKGIGAVVSVHEDSQFNLRSGGLTSKEENQLLDGHGLFGLRGQLLEFGGVVGGAVAHPGLQGIIDFPVA